MWSKELCKLPVELLAVHIIPLVTLKDLVNIESAVVHELPEWWQAAIQLTAPLDLDEFSQSCLQVMRWILHRGLKVTGVTFRSSILQENCDEFLELLNGFSGALSNLTLVLTDLQPSNGLLLLSKCSRLKIENNYNSALEPSLCTHAVNLTQLELNSSEEDCPASVALFLQLLKLNPGLQSVKTSVNLMEMGLMEALNTMGRKMLVLKLTADAEQMCAVAPLCPNLTRLHVASDFHCDKRLFEPSEPYPSGDDWLEAVAEHCYQLQRLSDVGFAHSKRAVLRFLQRGGRHLRQCELLEATLDVEILRAMAAYGVPLENLEYFDGTLDGEVVQYQRLFSHLHVVKLHPTLLGLLDAPSVVSCMHNLRDLSMELAGDNIAAVFDAVALHCPHLHRLRCYQDTPYRDAAFVTALCSVIARCTFLVHLLLAKGESSPLPQSLADSFCAHGGRFEYIYVSAYFFTDAQVIHLAASFTKLGVLMLPLTTKLTNEAVLALAKHCGQLILLDIRKCTGVTEEALVQLIQRCRKLEHLCVAAESMSAEVAKALNQQTQDRLHGPVHIGLGDAF